MSLDGEKEKKIKVKYSVEKEENSDDLLIPWNMQD